MNLIPSDRALAHWRSLTGLSPARARRLRERLQQEHPELIRFVIAALWEHNVTTVVPTNAPLAMHPRPDQVETVLNFAAALSELFRREAGHPVRPVRWNDLNHHWLELDDLRPRLVSTPVKSDRSPLSRCHQSELIMGIIVAYVSSHPEEPGSDAIVLLGALVEAFDRAATDERPTLVSNDWTVDRVEDALSVQGDPLRREALETAPAFQTELTQRFLAEIDQWVEHPEVIPDEVSFGQHGIHQLAAWRETTAWPAIRSLFSLPGEGTFEFLGYVVTESGPVLLASVVGQRVHELRELFENQAVNSYCRGATLEALACLVAWGESPREDLVSYLQELLSGRLAESDRRGWSVAVNVASHLEAWNLLSWIESAFENHRVELDFITLDEVYYYRDCAEGSVWANFVKFHPRITSVADATTWLDFSPDFDDDEDEDAVPEPPPGLISGSEPYFAPAKVGRNDPCPCGSGRKFKKCCG